MNYRFYIGLLVLLSFEVSAASFDCNQKLNGIEKFICADQNASSLDHELSKKYQRKMKSANEEGKLKIKSDQRDWLKGVRNKCQNIDCIKNSYMIRIYHLDNYRSDSTTHKISYDGELRYIYEYYNSDYRVSSFNKIVTIKFGSEISSCFTLVGINGGKNTSYGGYCTLMEGEILQEVLICDDKMVGHFKMVPSEDIPDIYALDTFVRENCYGG